MHIRATQSRALLVTALALAIVGALTGCVGISELVPHSFGITDKPAVGDCWQATYEQAENDDAWKRSAPVACAAEHELYTFAVVQITSSDKTWNDASGNIKDSLVQAINAKCRAPFTRLFPKLRDTESRLRQFHFIAPTAQWRQGARWARCDIAVAKSGSPVRSPRLAELPADIRILEHQVRDTPALFDTCRNVADAAETEDPLNAKSATIANCLEDPLWTLLSTIDIPFDGHGGYPGTDYAANYVWEGCHSAAGNRESTSYYPDAVAWSEGVRGGSCWIKRM